MWCLSPHKGTIFFLWWKLLRSTLFSNFQIYITVLLIIFTMLLEKGMATHSSVLAWRIPWTEELVGLQSMGSQRVRHNWVTNTHTQCYTLYPHELFYNESLYLLKPSTLFSHLLPLATTNLLFVSMISVCLFFKIPHISEIIWSYGILCQTYHLV